MRWKLILGIAAVTLAPPSAIAQAAEEGSVNVLPGGARWAAEVPANWNGTLLLWSRGYSVSPNGAEAAPKQHRQALLDAGYAIAGSDYGSGGWALAEAVPAQRATIAAFAKAHGEPKRVIAWGNSMGGLVSTALAEQRGAGITGAASFCSSMGGAVGMMNMALDGAYAFRLLVAPDAGIELVDISDDRANGKRVAEVLAAAMKTPEGRARVALAGVLAGIPGWTRKNMPQPDESDYETQVEEIADAFVMGVMLPRTDQERRAGGAFSWNRGIDYNAQLALSGRREMVDALYRKAGLDLDRDIAALNGGKRIEARPAAVKYMTAHYTPNAKPLVPVVAVQMVGDGQTSPALQRAYADAARSSDVQSLWVQGAGHCNFSTPTVLATIRFLDQRIASGKWASRPEGFVTHTPQPMMRPCVRGGICR